MKRISGHKQKPVRYEKNNETVSLILEYSVMLGLMAAAVMALFAAGVT